MLNYFKQSFKGWSKAQIAWIVCAPLFTLILALLNGDTPLSIISSITGIVGVIMLGGRSILGFIFAIINIATYTYLAFTIGLYSETVLNLVYYIPMQVYGLFAWKKSLNANDNQGAVEVKSMSKSNLFKLLAGTAVATAIYAFILARLGDGRPVPDAIISITSMIATLLNAKQFKTQWLFWFTAQIASVIVWTVALVEGFGNVCTVIQWFIFLINSCFGVKAWNRES